MSNSDEALVALRVLQQQVNAAINAIYEHRNNGDKYTTANKKTLLASVTGLALAVPTVVSEWDGTEA